VQLQNLPRPSLKQKAIDTGIEDVKADAADLIHAKPMELLQSAVRGCIVAPPGRKLVVADLSNIEGRMLAFLAGEEWKLQAFRDFDTCLGADGRWYAGDELRDAALARRPIVLELDRKGEPKRKGHDLYALAYAKAFRITPEAVMENKASGDGSMRQIGKVMELALGYEGGVGAFVTFALAYGIDLDDMAVKALSSIPQRVREEAERAYEWAVKQKRTFDMAKDTYVVCDSFKRLWREAHPKTAVFWKALQTAFVNAISAPGSVHYARDIRVTMSGKWVRMILPSGRSLCYPSPKLDDNNRISYMGINQYSRQWSRLHTYSGKLAENATQAAARDIIAAAMPSVEQAGYEIVSLVHDEDITIAHDTPEYNADHLAALMASNPPWAVGLPLAAAGYEAYRYRKD
jgi:DNA polymerase